MTVSCVLPPTTIEGSAAGTRVTQWARAPGREARVGGREGAPIRRHAASGQCGTADRRWAREKGKKEDLFVIAHLISRNCTQSCWCQAGRAGGDAVSRIVFELGTSTG